MSQPEQAGRAIWAFFVWSFWNITTVSLSFFLPLSLLFSRPLPLFRQVIISHFRNFRAALASTIGGRCLLTATGVPASQKAAIALRAMLIGGLDAASTGRTVTVGAPIFGGAGCAEAAVEVGGCHPPLAWRAVAVALILRQRHQATHSRYRKFYV
jgi:hypothetical protein